MSRLVRLVYSLASVPRHRWRQPATARPHSTWTVGGPCGFAGLSARGVGATSLAAQKLLCTVSAAVAHQLAGVFWERAGGTSKPRGCARFLCLAPWDCGGAGPSGGDVVLLNCGGDVSPDVSPIASERPWNRRSAGQGTKLPASAFRSLAGRVLRLAGCQKNDRPAPLTVARGAGRSAPCGADRAGSIGDKRGTRRSIFVLTGFRKIKFGWKQPFPSGKMSGAD